MTKVFCKRNKIDNEREVGMQWRGRWCLGGVVNEITQKLRAIKARQEAIETSQRKGVVTKAHDVTNE